MERIKLLNRYQKSILLGMTVMVLVFSVLYPITLARIGFAYKDAILVPSRENDSTVYAGEMNGKQAFFTVFADKTVEFQYDGKIYGPYTAKEDPTAVPKDTQWADQLTGVELRCGDALLFRGGVLDDGKTLWLFDEAGNPDGFDLSVTTSSGVTLDENGNEIDPLAPSVYTILELMGTPALTHKGHWGAWLGGILICLVAAVHIVFADELFRLYLSFRIYNAEQAEPSDLEMASRYITWTVLPILAIVLFILGLS